MLPPLVSIPSTTAGPMESPSTTLDEIPSGVESPELRPAVREKRVVVRFARIALITLAIVSSTGAVAFGLLIEALYVRSALRP